MASRSVNPYWQFSITAGLGYAANVTFGYNNGQFNSGVFFGVGEGLSASYDPTESSCEEDHTEYGLLAEGKIGAGGSLDVSSYYSTTDTAGGITYGAPNTPVAISWGEENGQITAPSVAYTLGESAFWGAGSKSYISVKPDCPCQKSQ